jgi:amino acid adenylation domain-containing protein
MAEMPLAPGRVPISRPFIPWEEAAVEGSISDRFERQVAVHPERTAIKSSNQTLTYETLNQAANRLAWALLERCGDSSEPVAVLCRHDARPLIAMLAILKAGKFYVPIDASFPPARIGYILEDSQVKLAVTDCVSWNALEATQSAAQFLNMDEIDPGFATGNLGLAIPSTALAYLIYTSGSSGQPKGVLQTHRNILQGCRVNTNGLHISADDRFSLMTSLSYGASTASIYDALLNGAALFPFNLKERGLKPLAGWLIREQITIYQSVATVFRHFAWSLDDEVFPSLRVIKLGGETIYEQDIELFRKEHFAPGCIMRAALSTTETKTICWYLIDKQTEIKSDVVPVGYPLGDREIFLLDDDENQVGTDQVGEIAVRSRYISPGYWRRPDLTRAKFRADPNDPEKQTYLTGDLGRMRSDGCLEHLGRKDTQVKIRGQRVELGEVENTLIALDPVQEAAVAAWPDQKSELQLVAYVVPPVGQSPRGEALAAELAGTLPDFMVPSAFVLLDKLPQTPNGKLDRRALPRPDPTRVRPHKKELLPRDELERQVAALWEEVLEVGPVGRHDSFFDLGGHSLSAMRLFARIERTLGYPLPPSLIFQAPTVEKLAQAIRQGEPARKWPTVVAMQPQGDRPPFFLVHGSGGGIIGYAELARLLASEQPVIGLQAQGMNGTEAPHSSIEEMAAHYVNAMRAVQPEGPYRLGGYCYGGIVAYEMARQLNSAGEKVALLVMIESYAITRTEARRKLRHPKVMLATLQNLPLWLRDYLARRLDLVLFGIRKGDRIPWRQLGGDPNEVLFDIPDLPPHLAEARSQVVAAHRRAIRSYCFRTYPGRVTLFRVRALSLNRAYDPELGWGKLATGGVEVRRIAGAHYSVLLQPHVRSLATELKDCLDRTRTTS